MEPKHPVEKVTEVNPKDAGRFVNHSATPNFGFDGTLKDPAKQTRCDVVCHLKSSEKPRSFAWDHIRFTVYLPH